MADLLDTTARQVRLPRGTVHRLTTTRHDPTDGQRYTTSCDRLLTGADGAMLTTWPVGCTACQGTTRHGGRRA